MTFSNEMSTKFNKDEIEFVIFIRRKFLVGKNQFTWKNFQKF